MTADHAGQTGGERWSDHAGIAGPAPALGNYGTHSWPSRPVPVPGQALGAPLGEVTVGQAAREAAVEAALLADSPLRLGIVFGVDPSKHPEFWRRVAEVAVAALSAAPGQEQP